MPEPVYRSSAPLPADGYPQYPPPSSSPYRPPASNPYTPPIAPYRPNAYQDRARGGRSRPVRLMVLAGAALLGLLLIGYTIGQILGGAGSSPNSSAAAPPHNIQPAATATPTTQPTTAPTPTPAQGTGNAKFVRVSSDIPGGHCTTSQGCPVTVTLKNNGGAGSGSVTVTLTNDSGQSVATFTGPIPTTEAGATVTVTGYANSDQLPNYLKSGGIVHLTGVDVTNG